MPEADPDGEVEKPALLPSALKGAPRLFLEPKKLFLDNWDRLVDGEVWRHGKRSIAFGCVIGALIAVSSIALLRFLGYDTFFFVPSDLRAPQLSKFSVLRGATWIDDPLFNVESLANAEAAGIKYIGFKKFPTTDDDTLGYSAAENDRLESLIANSKTIDFLAYNAESFTHSDNVNAALKKFFSKPRVKMRVLLARPETVFYNDMATVTNDRARADLFLNEVRKNAGLLGQDAGGQTKKLQIGLYTTQLRIPIIIFDSAYCIVTIRLPPATGGSSIRLEVEQNEGGMAFVSQCLDHFNAIEDVAQAVDLKSLLKKN